MFHILCKRLTERECLFRLLMMRLFKQPENKQSWLRASTSERKDPMAMYILSIQSNSDIVKSSVSLKMFTLSKHLYYMEGVM